MFETLNLLFILPGQNHRMIYLRNMEGGYSFFKTVTMTIPHEWRVKSVISPRERKNIVSRERSSSETMFLLSRGEMTDFTCHEL